MSTSNNKKRDEEPPPRDDIARAAKAAGILGAILTASGFAVFGLKPGFSVLIGSAIAVANLLTMRLIIRSLLTVPEESEEEDEDGSSDETASKTNKDHKNAGRRGGVAWGIFAVLKIVILFGGVWILLTKELVDPMPLVVGYGVLPLGIAASALFNSLKPR